MCDSPLGCHYHRLRCSVAHWDVACRDGSRVALFLISANPKEAILRRAPWAYRLEGIVWESQDAAQAAGLFDLGPFRSYRQAADRIFDRLGEVDSVEELQVLMHGVFVEMFDAVIAGPVSRYEEPAGAFWENHS